MREALSFALAESADEALWSLWIVEVVPAPHLGRLRVIVEAPGLGNGEAIEAALERHQEALEAAKGRLRAEVADAIHRKKTPTLSFELRPASAMGPGGEE
ncbi:MAG: hypothetical protein OEY14_12900 [Myxococcales bacterium]|nr:hypothetical protein [Myxococcales bacterium]